MLISHNWYDAGTRVAMPLTFSQAAFGFGAQAKFTTPVARIAEPVATTVPLVDVEAPVRISNSQARDSGRPPFSRLFTSTVARLALVNVHVTFAPCTSVIVAARVAMLAEPPAVHVSAVRSKPGVAASVTV